MSWITPGCKNQLAILVHHMDMIHKNAPLHTSIPPEKWWIIPTSRSFLINKTLWIYRWHIAGYIKAANIHILLCKYTRTSSWWHLLANGDRSLKTLMAAFLTSYVPGFVAKPNGATSERGKRYYQHRTETILPHLRYAVLVYRLLPQKYKRHHAWWQTMRANQS